MKKEFFHIQGKTRSALIALLFSTIVISANAKIDRHALVTRNNPHVTRIDTLSSLSVGNGEFAFTCDVTGMQTFPELYRNGVPLGTMAQWAWHSFPNPEGYKAEDALKAFNFGRGKDEWYSCQWKTGREKAASDYLRANPHRVHLGTIGFVGMDKDMITDISQTLDLWDGIIYSSFKCKGRRIKVQTSCDASKDKVVFCIDDPLMHDVQIRFPYPTGKHSDDACDWSNDKKHTAKLLIRPGKPSYPLVICNTMDGQTFYAKLQFSSMKHINVDSNRVVIIPDNRKWTLQVEFTKSIDDEFVKNEAEASVDSTKAYWNRYWQTGGAVDFSRCTDPRARELERRVVLSQYLLAIQCAGSTPPQETGLTYNSWFGKFHLEMIWWHQAHFALWGHPEMLARTLPWYEKALPMAHEIARRQGFDGARWMKMTDPSAAEAPSNVGSFLIWQQPHLIYLCELLYRATGDEAILHRYANLVDETARFMASFATYDEAHDRYVLKGCIPAQETLKASETINPPFELSYWHYALGVAQQWRQRMGQQPREDWQKIIDKLSPLAAKDGVYAAAETAESYLSPSVPLSLYSDHMAVLGSCGVLPFSPQYDKATMTATLNWVMNNWNWDKTWGWDYPMTAMCAVRLGMPDVAINVLLMDKRTNTYLPNGHNYQDARLRCYLPGNGGLLTTIALMCAGWDGCTEPLPGFPKNGKWNVEYEGIKAMP
ncbi:MAG: hypothetical protein IKQ72_08150 [Bacteroidaceae bacterium]|nr:hypothetical protein [Bacteroidaceae bacterium]